MSCWAGVLTVESYADEVLYARTDCTIRGRVGDGGGMAPGAGDQVLLVAAAVPPVLFGVGSIRGWFAYSQTRSQADVQVAYQRRDFDQPPVVDHETLVAAGVDLDVPGLWPLSADDFERLGATLRPAAASSGRAEWFVSVALPIEAPSRAEAVREFWAYMEKLGPRELPAFVWPRGDELAMQAYVLGAQTNLDPEEDEE